MIKKDNPKERIREASIIPVVHRSLDTAVISVYLLMRRKNHRFLRRSFEVLR